MQNTSDPLNIVRSILEQIEKTDIDIGDKHGHFISTHQVLAIRDALDLKNSKEQVAASYESDFDDNSAEIQLLSSSLEALHVNLTQNQELIRSSRGQTAATLNLQQGSIKSKIASLEKRIRDLQ